MIIEKKARSPRYPGRRSFLSKIWIGLGFVALAELIFGGISFFVSSRKQDTENSPPLIVNAGSITSILPGTMTFIHAGNCYLSRLKDGGFLAISRKCTHLGCAVPWVAERNQFECPCHASIFDNTGNVIKSPAPRALDLYPISFEHDMIRIDISKPIKRAGFAPEQLAYSQELS